MNERRDGGFEVVLAFTQFISVRRAAEGADRGEGSVCRHLHLGVARDELYAEPRQLQRRLQIPRLTAGYAPRAAVTLEHRAAVSVLSRAGVPSGRASGPCSGALLRGTSRRPRPGTGLHAMYTNR